MDAIIPTEVRNAVYSNSLRMQKLYCPICIYTPSVIFCIANNGEILFAVPDL